MLLTIILDVTWTAFAILAMFYAGRLILILMMIRMILINLSSKFIIFVHKTMIFAIFLI